MVTDGNYTYCGENFIMYVVVKSLCCPPEINIILYISYPSIKKIAKVLKQMIKVRILQQTSGKKKNNVKGKNMGKYNTFLLLLRFLNYVLMFGTKL